MSADVDTTAEEVGAELVVVDQPPATLFRTDDPVEVIERAGAVADALKGVLEKQALTKRIQGKDHVLVEGWTTLGSMLGVVPVVVWSRAIPGTERPYERQEGYEGNRRTVKGVGSDWEARVEARTMDGRTVGAAEAMCTRDETRWSAADDYAVRSMAQTRATSKALRGPLGFIVTLAGYVAIPAEEMPADDGPDRFTAPTAPQLKYLRSLITKSGAPVRTVRAMLDTVQAQDIEITAGWTDRLTREQVSRLIELFKAGALPDPEQQDIPTDDPPAPEPVDDGEPLPWEPEPAA